jgi:hypothetical protein
MLLVGLPVAMIRRRCRALLQSPAEPETWQAPGLPDARAGWPASVALTLAGVAAGLAPNDAYADRLLCVEARRELQAAYEAAGGASPTLVSPSSTPVRSPPPSSSAAGAGTTAPAATTVAAATASVAEGYEGRECVICMEAPRQVRFAPCGHAATCRSCAEDLRRAHQPCPSCRGEVSGWADEGRHVALQTTFVQQPRPHPQHAPEASPQGGDAAFVQAGRGFGGRGGRGVGGGRR